ncbi:MAG: Rho termination factor N-terminal domain-containing protein [Bacilli bacterium]|nr:Rho termination factor N-terminal domain-containing protein [Bacilli bacterium]
MEKALESVKKREDRRRPDNKFRNNNKPFNRRFDNKDNNRNFKREVNEAPKANEEIKTVKEETTKVVVEKANDISKLTVAELRDLAKDKDIKGYSTMKKAELIDALK